jgi:hypothetical protein
LLLIGTGRASAVSTLHVCKSGCPYTQIAPALADAKSGDTVKIGPGTYAGGLTINTSVELVGAGSGSTIISGGGPVLTIGEYGAATEPTVSIDGVRITGGVTRSSPESTPFTGQEGVVAVGGGVEMPPNADFSGGATVTIRNSVITGNRVAPTDTVPAGPPCPSGPCPFAFAGGGGIDSWGTLTLANTTVSNNRVGSASGLSTLSSDADGGAIINQLGRLTIRRSVIDGNRESASGPNGRFAEGGAIYMSGPRMSVRKSLVTDNHAALAASLPSSVDQLAIGGGFQVTKDVSVAKIIHTKVSGNSVTMTNTVGAAEAFSGGIQLDPHVDAKLRNSVVADNRVRSATLGGSSADAEGDSGAGELTGKIRDTRIKRNRVSVSSADGDASAFGGGLIDRGSIAHSVLSHNHVRASSATGRVFAAAGALVVDKPRLTVRHTAVRRNTVDANGTTGTARGGGIYDARIPHGPPGGPLTLVNSSVTGNTLTGGAGLTIQGGGIYIRNQPLTLAQTGIADNSPDQCHGC